MGSSDSKSQQQSVQDHLQTDQIPTDPLINRLRRAFRLQTHQNNPKITHSFLFGRFSQQIINTNASKIDPNNSPFCYSTIKNINNKSQQIVTCAMISPIMALAPAKSICDQKGYIYHKKLILHCCPNKIWVQKVVNKIVTIQNTKLVLLILQEPIWELGWSGVTYLEQSAEINDLPLFRIINEAYKKQNQSKSQMNVKQMISRVYFKDLGDFRGKALRPQQSLVFVIRERKTYIVGVQNGQECTFFNVYTLKDMRAKVNDNLSMQDQRQFLKMIDLQQMQIQTSW